MVTTVQLLFLSIPYAFAAMLGIGGVLGGFFAAFRPIIVLVPYIALLLYFPNSGYGLVEVEDNRNLYSRGMGYLFFPAINVMLFGIFSGTAFGRLFVGAPPKSNHALAGFTVWFPLLIGAHFVIGIAIGEKWYLLVQPDTLFQFVYMAMFLFILLRGVRNEQELRWLIVLFLVAALSRGMFGAVRYFAMGGDPSNFYANVQRLNVKLTFFDINDGLIATVAAFGIAYYALSHWRHLGGFVRVGAMLAVLLELFLVAFSFRRTSMIGTGLALLLLIGLQPRKLRIGLLAGLLGVAIPGMIFLLERRLSTGYGGTLLERLFPDIVYRGSLSFSSGRFAELYAALLTIRDNVLLGVGSWGQFQGQGIAELYFHRGHFGWMHSGLLHIMLKTGVIGLGIFVWAIAAHVRFIYRTAHEIPESWRAPFWASAAGAAYLIPDWLFGTPVIEYRTMQLFAFVLAMPYMVYAVSRQTHRTPVSTEVGRVTYVPQFAK